MSTGVAIKRTIDTVTAEILLTQENVKRVFLEGVVRIGRCLEEAKEMVPTGSWTDYLQTIGYKPSTAQNYMRIAREFGSEQIGLGGKSAAELFGGLGYSQVLPLLGLPEEDREALAEDNDLAAMSSREIEKLKKDHLAAQQAAQQAAQVAQDRAEKLQEKIDKADAAKGKMKKAAEDEKAAREAAEAKIRALEGQVEAIMQQAQVTPLTAEVVPEEAVIARIRAEVTAEQEAAAHAAQERAAELERKLEKARNPAAVQVNFIFKEMQSNWARLVDALAGLDEAETADKMRTAINSAVEGWRA